MISLPVQLSHRIRRSLGNFSLTPIAAGFSGAVVFRCDLESGPSLAIKRLPAAYRNDRLAEVHRAMFQIHAAGFSRMPKIIREIHSADQTFFKDSSGIWEVTTWIAGEPLPPSADSRAILAGVKLLAQFHRASAKVGSRIQVAPAITDRLSRITQCECRFPAPTDANQCADQFVKLHQDIGPAPPDFAATVADLFQLLTQDWSQVARIAKDSLSPWRERPIVNLPVLRDVHREHILFDCGQPSGLIDFDAMRLDTPMADLTRWMGSFPTRFSNQKSIELAAADCDPRDLWRRAMAEYSREWTSMDSHSEETWLDLALGMHLANSWISLVSWADWLSEPRFFAAGPDVVDRRIRHVLRIAVQSLESMR